MFGLSVLANFTSSFLPALSAVVFVHNQSNLSTVQLDPLLSAPYPTCEFKYDDYIGANFYKWISDTDSLEQAIENSDTPCIIQYAKQRNINQKTSKKGLPIEIAINTGNTETIKTVLELGAEGAIGLMSAVTQRNVKLVQFLLDEGVDPHSRVVMPEAGIDATCYQAAMTSNKAIKKLFRRKYQATNVPADKNPWTKQYEDIIRKIASPAQVEYKTVTNQFGNVYFDPIIDGVYYPLHSIITKMDWRQVSFSNDEFQNIRWISPDINWPLCFFDQTKCFIQRYIFGSFDLNAFLMGQPQYIRRGELGSNLNQIYSNYWLLSAGVAHELHNLRIKNNPDPDEVVCRGQGTYDRTVRSHHASFISTSNDLNVCMNFAKGAPVVVLEENQGVDLQVNNYQHELVVLPTTLAGYQFFSLHGQHFYLANALYSPSNSMSFMPEGISGLFTNVFDQFINPSAISYTSMFAEIIHKVVTSTRPVNTHLVSNQYGQLYYHFEIDGTTYDMYDIISHMDWDQFQLREETLAAFPQSKYHLWDEQEYTNFYSLRVSATIVREPVKLKDIDSTLKLTQRESVPQVCDDKPCDYDTLYSDLTAVEKGLIFQYTSVASKSVNSFFKGSEREFRDNIQSHTNRWRISEYDNTEAFDINDPTQWLVYSARLSHALNKIKPSRTQGPFCRGQSHMDRQLRVDHPAPISASKDFKLCDMYRNGKESDIVILDKFNGKYISPLSFHPDQDEYLGQPAMLDNYKKYSSSRNDILNAKVKPYRR